MVGVPLYPTGALYNPPGCCRDRDRTDRPMTSPGNECMEGRPFPEAAVITISFFDFFILLATDLCPLAGSDQLPCFTKLGFFLAPLIARSSLHYPSPWDSKMQFHPYCQLILNQTAKKAACAAQFQGRNAIWFNSIPSHLNLVPN